MESLLFKFSGCANRGLMAQQRSPLQLGRSEPGKSENWGRPSGGTNFLIARTGGDFNVPIRKAAWRGQISIRRIENDGQHTFAVGFGGLATFRGLGSRDEPQE
jgi:hypothetical protein